MIIRSLLDTDLYKLTMQQAILFGRFAGVHFQSVPVRYDFINRNDTPFPAGFADALIAEIRSMSQLQLVENERNYLQKLRFLKPGYIDFLSGYRFNPSEVSAAQTSDGRLEVRIEGPWYRTVLWEVPLMAVISELYFQMTHPDWEGANPANVIKTASDKAVRLKGADCHFADFGSRRRFSREVHQNVVSGLCVRPNIPASGKFTGTSNVWLAMLNGVKPIGTHAHEWFQAMAALFGYRQANRFALEAWAEEYDGDLGIALSDTFTTEVFFQNFHRDMAKLWDGVRHDSADPMEFARKTIAHYESLQIPPISKTIVFSDSLNVDKAIDLQRRCSSRINCAFGIGTHFTNDVGVKPLNMVIKMTRCNGMPTVKLSDAEGKNTGEPAAIESCKFQLGLSK
jgi:nicotinate phosphoribosyltransferase